MERDRLQAQLRQQQAQLRQAKQRLAALKAEAQKDLSRHLHDNVGASLTGLNLDLTLVLHELATDTPNLVTVTGLLQDALRLVGQVSEVNSRYIEELRPPYLDKDGLAAALRWYVQTFQSRVEFPIMLTVDADFPRLDPLVEYELYLIAQEAIVNAAKHAHPKQVSVSLHAAANVIRLAVVDDGVGISLAQLGEQSVPNAHWGLINILERAELMGGRCDIVSKPGAGTQIVAEVGR
jgi:signal transduction histidine kinase